MKPISAAGIGLRFIFALLLVVASYNPSGYSFIHWLLQDFQNLSPWMVLCGIILLIGWIIYINATIRSLGPIGVILACALSATLLWALIDLGWLNINTSSALVWVVELLFALILCVGMSWSHIRRRLSGQVDVDDVDD